MVDYVMSFVKPLLGVHYLESTRILQCIATMWNYLANLQWTESVQDSCAFCDHDKIDIIYQVRKPQKWVSPRP